MPARRHAMEHPDGSVDLFDRDARSTGCRCRCAARCRGASEAPGYPTVHGTDELRMAYSGWLQRAHGVADLDPGHVLPTIGSKELVASLPTLLGLRAGDIVVVPELAYPTYEIGAIMAGATAVRGRLADRARVRSGCRCLDQLAVQPDRAGAAARAPGEDRRPGPGPAGRSSPPTSATSTSGGNRRRCRSCIPRSAAATSHRICWRCTRCPSDPTWPATGPGSSPVIRIWWRR